MTSLRYLSIDEQGAKGVETVPFPLQLFSVLGLEVLNLVNFGLSGSLPSEISLWANLTALNLIGNPSLGGDLSRISWNRLTKLEVFTLIGSNLTGQSANLP
jgi:hypothetical protein